VWARAPAPRRAPACVRRRAPACAGACAHARMRACAPACARPAGPRYFRHKLRRSIPEPGVGCPTRPSRRRHRDGKKYPSGSENLKSYLTLRLRVRDRLWRWRHTHPPSPPQWGGGADRAAPLAARLTQWGGGADRAAPLAARLTRVCASGGACHLRRGRRLIEGGGVCARGPR